MKQFDIVVLGGGIYGLYTALFLSQREVTVAVIDIDQNFFSRASMVNQARLHNGLHYPRGQKTVNTILKYKERFIHDFGESINSQFKAYYAIANNESLTNKSEYEDFMNRNNIPYSEVDPNTLFNCNHTIFRHANFIGCLSADKIKMPVRKYFCFNIPVYRNMAEEPSCRSPYHEEYIQTSVSGNSEGLCRSTYSFLSERR